LKVFFHLQNFGSAGLRHGGGVGNGSVFDHCLADLDGNISRGRSDVVGASERLVTFLDAFLHVVVQLKWRVSVDCLVIVDFHGLLIRQIQSMMILIVIYYAAQLCA
jgi:hypothetical protein